MIPSDSETYAELCHQGRIAAEALSRVTEILLLADAEGTGGREPPDFFRHMPPALHQVADHIASELGRAYN